MGTYLSHPVLDKNIDDGTELTCAHTPVAWSCVDMQGWRKTMEDAHVARVNVHPPDDDDDGSGGLTSSKVFAVFDGHGGAEVARFCREYLVEVLISREEYRKGELARALVETFHELDRMIDDPKRRDEITQMKMEAPVNVNTYSSTDATAAATSATSEASNFQRRSQKDRSPTSSMRKATDVSISQDENDHEKMSLPDKDTQDDGGISVDSDVDVNVSSEVLQDDYDNDNDNNGNIDDNENINDNDDDADNDNDEEDNTPEKITTITPADAMVIFHKLLTMNSNANNANPPNASPMDEDQPTATTLGMSSSPDVIADNEEKKDQPTTTNANAVNSHHNLQLVSSMRPTDTPTRMLNGRQVCNLPDHPVHAGCTSVVVLIVNRTLVVANAGDSRAVLCRSGGLVEPLSFDHKPQQECEKNRIAKAGGFVNQFGRVNGNLNLSRSIGDLKYKQTAGLPPSAQMITAEPDIVQVTLQSNDEFIIIGCDGIWDCLTNEQAVAYVRDRIDSQTPTQIGIQMLNDIVSNDPRQTQGIGGDNMTILIVDLLPNQRPYHGVTMTEASPSLSQREGSGSDDEAMVEEHGEEQSAAMMSSL
mmetsp:Transcript_576/g.744  ORF Transcript_576/g.744 Transcript_576/m.744 type:complete len:591 (-) Transcript_576:264-2036(-)|eukprot:CAMPEP_0172501404 /NCGR_PEP_ID=MMETSP1066-20121228/149479_1 /TAXON_ID=671091 /ORGANISM="Coscinodiscus wailesii, Strain CCMP2513" /LENGTH=590 /DNA_ID=CAMNT_0013276183 /DNA_START=175 /DNA_END=1947 /DNA_ORIENTATION=+